MGKRKTTRNDKTMKKNKIGKKLLFALTMMIIFLSLHSNRNKYDTHLQTVKSIEKYLRQDRNIGQHLNLGTIRLDESYFDVVVKNQTIIPHAEVPIIILRYRDHKSKKVEINRASFKKWLESLSANTGNIPNELILILTDKQKFTSDNNHRFYNAQGITFEEFNSNQKRYTVSVILGVGSQPLMKNFEMELFKNPENYINAILATEMCNAMYVRLQSEERDQLCISVGFAVGSNLAKTDYSKYHKQTPLIMGVTGRLTYVDPTGYQNIKNVFTEGPILKLKYN